MAEKYDFFEPDPRPREAKPRWVKRWELFCKCFFYYAVLAAACKLFTGIKFFGFELPNPILPFGPIASLSKAPFEGNQETVSKGFRWSDVSSILESD
jgi:hypothetical protein